MCVCVCVLVGISLNDDRSVRVLPQRDHVFGGHFSKSCFSVGLWLVVGSENIEAGVPTNGSRVECSITIADAPKT